MERSQFFVNRFGSLVEEIAKGESVIIDGIRVKEKCRLNYEILLHTGTEYFYEFKRVTNSYK